MKVYTFGTSYNLMDRVTLKAQYARVKNPDVRYNPDTGEASKQKDNFTILALAASVYF